jgi:predicted Zn-dependent peptidase
VTHIHHFANGLVLIAEEIQFLRSVAVNLAIPAGCRYEPADRLGLAGITCEMVQRGAGKRDSRQLLSALDLLGVERSSSVTASNTIFNFAMPAESLLEAVSIYADIVRRPHLPKDQLDDAKRGALLELQASEDDLAGRVLRQMRASFYGDLVGRDPLGSVEGISSTSAKNVAAFVQNWYQPAGGMIAVAGKFDWPELLDTMQQLFNDWQPKTIIEEPAFSSPGGHIHLEHPSQQTHICVAFPAVAYHDASQLFVQGAVGVLGSGVSSRLFTKVREARGLCYTISASYGSSLKQGVVSLYAGTTSPRAQETLDVAWQEVMNLGNGIELAEVERLKVRLASLLVLEQESSSSRASAMISDWYHLGRVMTAEEIQAEIDSLTAETILEHWRKHAPANPLLITLGPEPLRAPWELAPALTV